MPRLPLPLELEPFREKIEATVQPTIKIKTKEEATAWHQSKFAGLPYLPKNRELPKSPYGTPMKLLAQINFEELPAGFLEFPQQGILQFFLSAEEGIGGMDYDDQTSQSNFKVIYHENLVSENELVTDFSFLPEPEEEDFPASKELALSFEVAEEAISVADRTFYKAYNGIDFEEVVKVEENEEFLLYRVYAERFSCDGHKIGGHPFFTQVDIREHKKYSDYNVLLLQIDTDDKGGITWGDTGVGNFFIKQDDLKKRNFSNVLYNWDCC